jgi:hypothetical protein
MKRIKICLLLLAVGLAGNSWSQDLLNTIKILTLKLWLI